MLFSSIKDAQIISRETKAQASERSFVKFMSPTRLESGFREECIFMIDRNRIECAIGENRMSQFFGSG